MNPTPLTIDVPGRESATAEALLEAAARQFLLSGDWQELRWICAHPCTPESLLMELARCPELHDELGHRPGPPQLLELLANDYGYLEAVIAVGKRLYLDAAISEAQFGEYLKRHGSNGQLLRSLLHEEEQSPGKRRVLVDACREHADAPALADLAEERLLIRQAISAVDPAQIQELFNSGRHRVWHALAGNPHTPSPILARLSSVGAIPLGRQIRILAARNSAAKNGDDH